jgi:hypothetical protein
MNKGIKLVSDCDTQVIVGVEVTRSGSDLAQLVPMVEQVERRLRQIPAHEQLDAVAGKTEVYAQQLYKLRAATAEWVNAQARNRGLQQLPVRGLPKVWCVLLLFALTHNLMRAVALVPQWFGAGRTACAAPAGAA